MKTEKEIHQHRKDEHISLAYKYWREEKNQTLGLTFSDSRIIPNSLPELSTEKINFSSEVFGQNFEFPFYIEAARKNSAFVIPGISDGYCMARKSPRRAEEVAALRGKSVSDFA